MFPSYQDIIEAAAPRKPLWWDMNGVPRFAPFRPQLLGVYDTFAILVAVRCSDPHCQAGMLVGCGSQSTTVTASGVEQHTLESMVAGFVYGDAPRHDCTGWGETSAVDELVVIEAWERHDTEWVRRAGLEVPFCTCAKCQWTIVHSQDGWIDWKLQTECPEGGIHSL